MDWINGIVLKRKEEERKGKKRLLKKNSHTVLWINPSGKLSTTQLFPHSPKCKAEENQKGKSEKLIS